ncbi:unnamed protein product [Calypogeia fissa]
MQERSDLAGLHLMVPKAIVCLRRRPHHFAELDTILGGYDATAAANTSVGFRRRWHRFGEDYSQASSPAYIQGSTW